MNDLTPILMQAQVIIMNVGFKILGAIVLWVVGRWLVGFAIKLVTRALQTKQVDQTLVSYLSASVGVLLNVALVIAILGFLGVETTTFAALIAAGGIAIGMAWSGMLSNFAAGVFLVVLRPFKVGEMISAGGITGTVHSMGLFATIIDTPDNIRTIVGNNKIFSETIQNFSANAYLRVDLTAQIANEVDHNSAIKFLKERFTKIPNVLSNPAPDVEILSSNLAGPVLTVRPYCAQPHYWQVYFDTNKMIRDAFTEAGYPTPNENTILIMPASEKK